MKKSYVAAFVFTVIHLPALAVAPPNEKTIRKLVETRASSLRDMVVTYTKTEVYEPLDLIPQHTDNAASGGGRLIPMSGRWKKEETLSCLDGRMRLDSVTVEHKRDYSAGKMREQDRFILVLTGDLGQRLTHNENAKTCMGTVGPRSGFGLDTDADTLAACLGLMPRTYLYVDPNNPGLVGQADDRRLVLRKTDKNAIYEWTFEKELGYAPVLFRLTSLPDMKLCAEVKMENFKNVAGVFLPMKIVTRHMDPREGRPETVFQDFTYFIKDYKLNDPDNTPENYRIAWPDNTFVHDRNTKTTVRYQDGRIVPLNAPKG